MKCCSKISTSVNQSYTGITDNILSLRTLVTALTATPWSSRNRIMFTWPKWQAVCSGVYPAYDDIHVLTV